MKNTTDNRDAFYASVRATEELRRALSRVGWNMNLTDFCRVLEWEIDDYAKGKFADFQQMCRLINQFDSVTLDRLIHAGEPFR